mgnify:CR=1 FL=1
MVGELVGESVGVSVGARVGLVVGLFVGLFVGIVGMSVGVAVKIHNELTLGIHDRPPAVEQTCAFVWSEQNAGFRATPVASSQLLPAKTAH